MVRRITNITCSHGFPTLSMKLASWKSARGCHLMCIWGGMYQLPWVFGLTQSLLASIKKDSKDIPPRPSRSSMALLVLTPMNSSPFANGRSWKVIPLYSKIWGFTQPFGIFSLFRGSCYASLIPLLFRRLSLAITIFLLNWTSSDCPVKAAILEL